MNVFKHAEKNDNELATNLRRYDVYLAGRLENTRLSSLDKFGADH